MGMRRRARRGVTIVDVAEALGIAPFAAPVKVQPAR